MSEGNLDWIVFPKKVLSIIIAGAAAIKRETMMILFLYDGGWEAANQEVFQPLFFNWTVEIEKRFYFLSFISKYKIGLSNLLVAFSFLCRIFNYWYIRIGFNFSKVFFKVTKNCVDK